MPTIHPTSPRQMESLRRARWPWPILGCLFLLVVGCQRGFENADFSQTEMARISLPAEIEVAGEAQSDASESPRLIRNGSVRMEVNDLNAALASVQGLIAGVGGFVAGSDLVEGNQGSRHASLVLRVPSDSFEPLVDSLSHLGRVLSVSINASDVSREYLDVETRLAVKEETVQRLRELAARSGSLEDLLAAERELGRAVGELESLKGQLRYYDQRIAESDLRLSLMEPGAVIGPGALRPVVEAFRDAAEVFGQSVAYLIYLLVFLVPWVLLALLAWPFLRRWRRSRAGPENAEGSQEG